MFLIALIIFLGFYNRFYREADLLSEYKVVIPGWMMQIFSFPANICKKVPLINRIMPKERVYDMSVYNVMMLTYAMISVVTTSVFYLLEDDFEVSAAWCFILLFVASIVFIISVLCDICFKRKYIPLKILLLIFGLFGTFIMLFICMEEAKGLSGYVWSTLFGTVVAYVIIYKVSYVEQVDGKHIKYTFEDGLLKIDCGKRKIDIPLKKITKVVISGRINFFEDDKELVSMALNGEEIGVAQELVEKYYCQSYEMDIINADDWRRISFAEFEEEVEMQRALLSEKLDAYENAAGFELIGQLEQPYKLWAAYSIMGQKDNEPVKIFLKKDEMEWKAGTAVALPLVFKKNIEESVLLVYKEYEKYMDEQFKMELEHVRGNSYEANERKNRCNKWGILLIILQIVAMVAILFVAELLIKVATFCAAVGIGIFINNAAKKDIWHLVTLAWVGIANIMLIFGSVLMLLA